MGFLADTLSSAPPATWAQMMQYYQPGTTAGLMGTGTPQEQNVNIPGIGQVQFGTDGQGNTFAKRANADGTVTTYGSGGASGAIAQKTAAPESNMQSMWGDIKGIAPVALAAVGGELAASGAFGAGTSAGMGEGWSGAAAGADPTIAGSGLSATVGGAIPGATADMPYGNLAAGTGGTGAMDMTGAAGTPLGDAAVASGAAAPATQSFNVGTGAAGTAGTAASTLGTVASGLGIAANLGNIVQGLGTAAAGAGVNNAAQTNAAAANPFAGQNAQYQAPLAASVAKSTSSPVTDYASIYGKQLNDLMTNPTAVLPTTPGYEAAMQAIQRSGAAQGYTGSGNMMTALATGIGGNFYQQQLADLQSLTNMGTTANNQNTAQLTQLAGGNWNPGTGASIAQTGATNQAQTQIAGLSSVVNGVTGLVNNAGTSTAPVSTSNAAASAWN